MADGHPEQWSGRLKGVSEFIERSREGDVIDVWYDPDNPGDIVASEPSTLPILSKADASARPPPGLHLVVRTPTTSPVIGHQRR